MADNIKIVGNILDTSTISRYSIQDINLIESRNIQENFGGTGDYIEYFIYDIDNNFLNIDYNYIKYKLPPSNGLLPAISIPPNTNGEIQTEDIGIISNLVSPTSSIYPIIEIDPVKDLQDLGYNSGEFNTRYNFFKNILSNNVDKALFIKEISSDRTEVRLASTTLTNDEIEDVTLNMINQINSSSYYVDYILNFGNNIQYVAINVALNKVSTGYEVLFKLYEPLPLNIREKDTLWVVEEKVTPYIFNINLDTLIVPPPPPKLRGPNFDISIPEQGTISTVYNNYNTAFTNLQILQSSSYSQILNLITSQSITINVDYTDFNNFIFFGSANQRVINFYNKVKQIENYQNLINSYTPYINTTSSLQTEINIASASINDIITNFDGYETYLYFESNSYAYPKSGSYKPYSLLPTNSPSTSLWYNTLIESALVYDNSNYDNLIYAIPSFISDDEVNTPFLLFLNMVGQYFDNIWVYLKAITDINLANNNLYEGISKDLVYNRLQSLGIKLYNSQAGDALDTFLIGANTGSNIFDNNFSVTSSYLNNIPRKDLVSELYKRIYHNLPLLLKTKGTKAGLEYLITTFGIPSRTYVSGSNISSSILDVKEYGGDLKSNLIKGYNNEKVRIISNTITGSVLSPLLSLQTFPTNSNDFRENDMHYIDISFSPENQINTYVSSAIASNNSDWRLDDYIGDPRQMYSSSYNDLYDQRKLYFETGVTGYPGFTSSLLDYNGFIRLIEYFDNSLFKMLNDFVPERASLSTGITIESPVLERNKVVYPIPDPLNQEIYDADYPAPIISSPYEDLYHDLGGDKEAYFNGEITGSEIDVYEYFEDTNYNPYIEGYLNSNWVIYNAKTPINERINLNLFYHSDFDVLFNNVSKNVTSQFRKRLDYIWGTTGSLTGSVELQDSYLNLQSYNNSRYLGTQLTSRLYNNYTSASYINGLTTQSGDISYGKTAVIDRNSYKLGWLQNIQSQSLNFYNKTVLNLKYLVDTKNELTDLNSYNNNWFEVQNIFKSGKPAILTIIDKNQNRRDGFKTVWKGGYRFDPIIYRENGDIMNFIFDEYQYTSSTPLGFLLTDTNKYEYETDQLGNDPKTPYTAITNIPNQSFFYINGVVSGTTPTGFNSLAPEVISKDVWQSKYNSYNTLNYTNLSFINNDTPTRTGAIGDVYRFDLFKYNNTSTIPPNSNRRGFFNEPISSAFENNVYITPRPGNYTLQSGVDCTLSILDSKPDPEAGGFLSLVKLNLLIESCSLGDYIGGNNNWGIAFTSSIINQATFAGNNGAIAQYNTNTNTIKLDTTRRTSTRPYVSLRFTINGLIPNVPPNTVFRTSFYFIDVQDAYQYADNINIKLSRAYWGVYDRNNITTNYFYDAQYTSSVPIFNFLDTTNKPNDTLLLNINFVSRFFYNSSFSGSSPNYSEVIDKFSIEQGDLIKFGRFQDPGEYYEVINVLDNMPNDYTIILNNTVLPTNLSNTSSSLSSNFAVLRPKPDETSVILEGRRALGMQDTQTALLIPYDASNILNNSVGTIIKSLNTTI